jgi:hypothetical protein
VILLLLLEKYIRHFRTSRKARYFKKPHSTVNYMYSREDEDPHTKQWLSFEKRRLQLTSRSQELFSSFSPSSAPHPLMHWTHGDVSLLLSLLKVVSRLQRVTSRRHFFLIAFPKTCGSLSLLYHTPATSSHPELIQYLFVISLFKCSFSY